MSNARVWLAVLALALVLGALAWLLRAREDALAVPEYAPRPSAGSGPGIAETSGPAEGPGASAPHARRAALAPEDAVAPRAPLRARLVDARTGEFVPWYLAHVDATGAETEALTSDAEGRIVTRTDLAAGPCRLTLIDSYAHAPPQANFPERTHIDHDPGAPPRDIAIAVGPTYALDVSLPRDYGPARFVARLQRDPTELCADTRPGTWPTTLLRPAPEPGALSWVRFADLQLEAGPPYLFLVSDDGLWSGGARVPQGYGVHRAPVRIVLEQRCAVRGRYVARDGAEVRGHGALALFRTAPDADGPRWEHTDGEGVFRLADLTPGAYRLEVRDEAVRAAAVEFTLAGGEHDLGDLAWEPIPVAGPVRLRLVSAVEVPLDVQLVRRTDPPRHAPWHSDQWEPREQGGFESLFEWEEVHAGEYDVWLCAHDAAHWRLPLGQLTPPVEDLELRLPDPPPPLRLEVVDDTTGAPLAAWSVIARQEDGWNRLDGPADVIANAVWGADAALAVVSPGYQAAPLAPAALKRPTSGEWRERVRLRRGWSSLFVARSRMRGVPVAGAEIVLDGVVAGLTDTAGELWVHRAAPPVSLEVRHPTLVLAGEVALEPSEPVTWIRLRTR